MILIIKSPQEESRILAVLPDAFLTEVLQRGEDTSHAVMCYISHSQSSLRSEVYTLMTGVPADYYMRLHEGSPNNGSKGSFCLPSSGN